MKPLPSSRVALYLGLILLVGVLARVPGLFWGYHFFGTETVILHPDEPPYTFGRGPETRFPRGLSVNVRLLASALEAAGLGGLMRSLDWDFFAGRLVALLYGLLTIIVVYRLARRLFDDERTGVLAALFLALADLHVTYSHIGIPDSPATFWFYAALASAYTALERGSRRAFILAAVCTGAAAAMRFQLMSLLPLAWWVARSKRRGLDGLLLAGTVSVAFLAFNGFGFNPVATVRLLADVAAWGDLGWLKLFLPLVYLAILVLGVGLPVFLLAGYGLLHLARAKWGALGGWRELVADNQVPVVLAPLAAFAQLCTVGLWAHRHAVVLVPFIAMLAAHGFMQLPRLAVGPLSAPATARALLALIAIYLGVQVASVQAYFVDDPLEKAGRWLREHVPPGEVLSKDGFAKVPPEYPTIEEWRANYLILSAQGYRRYLFRHFLPLHLTGDTVSIEDIEAGRVFAGDPEYLPRLRQLFGNELPYRLVRRVTLEFYTPELLLTQALWYPPPHLNEVLIYERRRERERLVELLTPLRTDYLLTLDTGRLWRLEAGQQVRLSLNGHPLDVRLREGTNHLLLPATLVAAPYSRFQLASDRPLPHLPVDALGRVRPVGREFAVESLLDGDLMPEGFSDPEVRADGATARWTTGVGRILLPGPGASEPWKHLAVRLRGRPSGAGPSQAVVFFLDGRLIGEALVGRDDRTVELAIPPGSATGPLATLQVMTPPWRPPAPPAAADPREQGVAVFWLRLSRADHFPRALGGMDGEGSSGPAWRPLFGLGARHRVERVSFPSGGLTLRGDLFAPIDGKRSVVLLAHGASAKGRKHGLYVGLARRLADRGYWVLSPDFRGYGESDDPPRIASPGDLDFTQDLVSALTFLQQRVGAKDVTVVGHSFGAGVALAVAARDPRVGRVVAISPGRRVRERVLGSPEGKQTIRDRMVFEMGLKPEAFPLELVEPVVVPIVIDTYAEHPFRQPVLLVDGELEEAADLRFLRDVYGRMKGDKAYVTIPNADHYFGIQKQVEERAPLTLSALTDVVDGWIRGGARWSRAP